MERINKKFNNPLEKRLCERQEPTPTVCRRPGRRHKPTPINPTSLRRVLSNRINGTTILPLIFLLLAVLAPISAWSESENNSTNELKVIETTPQNTTQEQTIKPTAQQQIQTEQTKIQSQMQKEQTIAKTSTDESIRYTLGSDDVVEVTVLRHPEFSGIFPVNQEGKIQLKFVGDMEVTGLTKKELEEKVKNEISTYVINPEVNVTITEYKSKFVYVIGEVGQAGKYYIRSENIKVRDAVTMAGLPTLSAAMRKCQIITPDKSGNPKIRDVDLYSVLYKGNLKKDLEMRAGDVLYVPSTVMAKLIRVINPVTATVNGASLGPTSVGESKSAITNMAK